jgi:hypothetical protein
MAVPPLAAGAAVQGREWGRVRDRRSGYSLAGASIVLTKTFNLAPSHLGTRRSWQAGAQDWP